MTLKLNRHCGYCEPILREKNKHKNMTTGICKSCAKLSQKDLDHIARLVKLIRLIMGERP